MTSPVGSFQGIASGVQWRDMVDQIMQNETAQQVGPIATQQTAATKRADAWSQFMGVLSKFRDAATALSKPSSFDLYTATAANSPTTSRAVVAATAGTGAAPGSYGVEVLSLARAEKLSGSVVTDASAALGVSGQFTLNGRAITVVAGDSLNTLRDKINAADAGTSASGVGASVLAVSSGWRLVLTSDNSGAAGIETVDDSASTLQQLGFTDTTTIANITAAGLTQTNRVSSSSAAIGSLLGIAVPGSVTIKVGGLPVVVNLELDSLSTIADKINVATGNPNAASVVSETVGGKTAYRLVTSSTVTADASGNLADSRRALAVLGFTTEGRGAVAQVLANANAFVDSLTATTATSSALLTNLQANGQSLGIAEGDTVTIAGSRGDGTAVSRTFTVGAGSTVADLLAAINDSSTGFGAGTRTGSATFTDGRLTLSDNTAGDSRLAISLTNTAADGTAVSLGGFSASNTGGAVGRSRQVVAPSDSLVRIDGQVLRRASNTITDAIDGVSLNLLSAEEGTTVTLSVTRDTAALTKSIQDFVNSLNAVTATISADTTDGASLAHDSVIRGIGASLNTALLSSITGLTGSLNTAAMVGLQHDRTGTLSLNTTTFNAFLQTNFDDVRKLFTITGTPSDSEVSFVSSGTSSTPTSTPYDIEITQAATQASVTGSAWSTYATAGDPDTISITDAGTERSGSITIANGDAIETVVQRLNSLFATQGMHLQAALSAGALKITATEYGTTGGFTVGYTPGLGGDGTAALGIAAQAYAGLNVAGTINGAVATGLGQILTGASGDASAGIALQYSGTTARSAGTITLSTGIGGTLASIASSLTTGADTGINAQITSAKDSAKGMQTRIDSIQQRLAARKDALIKQFLAMETALQKMQGAGAAMTSMLSGLQTSSS